MIPGEVVVADGSIKLNDGAAPVEMMVRNVGDRPIQVGSHAHFFETNRALRFDRNAALGMRLDIPSGTAVRFEPGDEMAVDLVELAGNGLAWGMNALTQGSFRDPHVRAAALDRAREQHFIEDTPP